MLCYMVFCKAPLTEYWLVKYTSVKQSDHYRLLNMARSSLRHLAETVTSLAHIYFCTEGLFRYFYIVVLALNQVVSVRSNLYR